MFYKRYLLPRLLHDLIPKGIGRPDPEDLCIDMRGAMSLKWNKAVADLLLEHVCEQIGNTMWNKLPEWSNMYILDLVKLQLECARARGRDAQPKVKEDGGIEGLDKVEQQMNEEKQEKGTMIHVSMRGRAVSPVILVIQR